MKIKNFEIRRYRSCIKTNLPLNEELTGLIGINGAGKSNVLNSLLFLKKLISTRYLVGRTHSIYGNKCFISVEIDDNGKSIFLKGDIFYETDEKNFDEVQETRFKWNVKDFSGDDKWISIPTEAISYYRHGNHIRIDNNKKIYYTIGRSGELFPIQSDNEKVYNVVARVGEFFNGINYYSASQFSDPSKCPVSIELDEDRPVKRIRLNANHEQFILDLYRSYKADDKQYKRYLNTVNSSGLNLIGGIAFNEVDMPTSSYEVKSGGKLKKIERSRNLIIPSIIIDNNELSPNQLSEGTFKTLALLFYILTDRSKLLLIEEPELGIHHGLLSSIIELIKTQSRFKQIIISTHSDYVLDHLKPENLILIKKDAGKGTTAKSLTKLLSRNDYQALKNYLQESGNLGEYWREGGFEYEK